MQEDQNNINLGQASAENSVAGDSADTLPNSSTVLVLGILSILLCWIYGVLSIILGIVGMVLASSAENEYHARPHLYSESSYRNLRAGKFCSTLGLVLGILSFLVIILWMLLFGAILFTILS